MGVVRRFYFARPARLFIAVLIATSLAATAACKKSSPESPSPSIVDLRISGPSTVLIGDVAGYAATATYSDGTSSLRPAAWSSTTTAVAEISASGQLTAWTAGTTSLSAAVEGLTATFPVQVTNPLVGQWIMVASTNPGNPSGIGTRMKTFTDTDWLIVQPNPSTGAIVFRHGGSYTLRGKTYSETVVFANASTANLIGQTFSAQISATADRFTQTSANVTEEWARVP